MIISITTQGSSGGTFLNWSLHYLAGHTEYYCVDKSSWCSVTDNPLTKKNSHGFLPNQINKKFEPALVDLINQTNALKSIDTPQFHSIYFHEFGHDDTLNQTAIDVLDSLNCKNIVVEGFHYPLYYNKYISRSSAIWTSKDKQTSDPDEIYNFRVKKYFNESFNKWNDLKLTNIWDKREFIALNFRPFDFKFKLKKPKNYYYVDGMDLWCQFDLSVLNLFNYLNLEINKDRFEKWLSVYNHWKTFHYERILFQLYFEKIIECILNGTYMNLSRFNLDIQQEATIQHVLLYKHNLNLKTWHLVKFTDTIQLHNLLEPNSHDLS